MACHPLHGRRLEQRGAVFDDSDELTAVVGEHEPQVELRDHVLFHRADGQPVGGFGAIRAAPTARIDAGLREVVEEDLEQGAAGAVPVGDERVHHLLEGQVLMGVGVQSSVSDAAEEFVEGGVAGEVRPHHQGVDEEPDQLLRLGAVPVRHRRAHDHVVRPRVPAEQDVERGQQGHEHGCATAAGQGAQGVRGPFGHGEANRRTGRRPHGRAGAVRRQLQHGRTGQLAAPVRELFLQHLPFQPLPLPEGEVGVLHRQRRQRVRRTRTERVVQL